jgi:hypothetical protein
MAVVRDFRTAARAAPLAADERPVAVAPHEQLGAVGEPMVAAAGHGRPAALGKARERSRAPLWEPLALWKED